jgi:hypothetical protein
MSWSQRETDTAILDFHKHTLGASIPSLPKVKITMTNACTLYLYKDLIVSRLWSADLFEF